MNRQEIGEPESSDGRAYGTCAPRAWLSRSAFTALVIATSCFTFIACNLPQESGGGAGGSNKGSGGSAGSSGAGGNGGSAGSGGTTATGGTSVTGGSAKGGGGGSGGSAGNGGNTAKGGSGGKGGNTAKGGNGGSAGNGGSSPEGGTSGNGGIQGNGGATAKGGSTGSGGGTVKGGTSGSDTTSTGDCAFTIISNALSTKMATVGVVEWSTALADVSSAKIVYTLKNAGASILNKGGTAPVDLKKSNYKTLLLGLKQSSDYTFYIEASSGNTTCKSSDYTLPKTGSFSGTPTLTRTTGTSASSQAVGFIVTSAGVGGGGGPGGGGGGSASGAYIFDADGAIVWYSTGPSQCSRARMDYEGVNMWMLSVNVQNSTGEMRFLSMDGQTGKNNVDGLSGAHHDFAVLPGKIAAMVWASTGTDPESNLIERASDGSGSNTTKFKIGSNLYTGGSSSMGGSGGNTYHCNSILYHAEDDTFTISDRNPNLYVKVKHDGTPVWQIGGSCSNAKAPKCAAGTWQVNHGHDFDKNGNMLIFNNGGSGGGGSSSTHILELKLTESTGALSFTTVKDFTSGTSSGTLGDVQRLPNGNTLITYSNGGQILEVDSSWGTVQTLKGTFGYAEWRETLYGPPER